MTEVTEFLISAITSFFIVTATKSYFEALFLQKLNKKLTLWMWVLIYIVTGPVAELISIPPQLDTNIMYIFIITAMYKGKWWKKIIALLTIYAVNILAEGAAYYTVNVDLHPELYLHAGVMSKVAYIIFMIFAIFIGKRICKDVSMSITDRIMLATLPTISVGTGIYIFLTQNASGGIKAIVCAVLLVVNVYVFTQFIRALKTREERENKDMILEEKEQEIIEKDEELERQKEINRNLFVSRNPKDVYTAIWAEKRKDKTIEEVRTEIIIDDIESIFQQKKKLIFTLQDGTTVKGNGQFNDVLPILNKNKKRFIRIGQSDAINHNHVIKYTFTQIITKNSVFNLTKTYQERVRKELIIILGEVS